MDMVRSRVAKGMSMVGCKALQIIALQNQAMHNCRVLSVEPVEEAPQVGITPRSAPVLASVQSAPSCLRRRGRVVVVATGQALLLTDVTNWVSADSFTGEKPHFYTNV
jgi:hypothetical protein